MEREYLNRSTAIEMWEKEEGVLEERCGGGESSMPRVGLCLYHVGYGRFSWRIDSLRV